MRSPSTSNTTTNCSSSPSKTSSRCSDGTSRTTDRWRRLGGIALSLFASIATAGDVDFGRDVLPILSDRCFHCHGPDAETRYADLRLDVRDAAVDYLGDADDSMVLDRIADDDPDYRMPPPETGDGLTATQIETLRTWIAAGSPYEEHWAFVPPTSHTPPPVDAKSRIDAHVVAELPTPIDGPSEPADPDTLLRRTSLTLTGLAPPTNVADDFRRSTDGGDPMARTRLVDRLLADPDHGVHAAGPWLDAVRYGDTHGMARDDERAIWPYRDWVVDAVNADLPFDEFTAAQIAGDLLPTDGDDDGGDDDDAIDAATANLVASGFNRCNVSTAEGGSIDEELIASYAADRVDTIGTVWMGLTIACAKCHDHKFDPTTQADYYRLTALFNNLDEEPMNGNAVDPTPVAEVPTRRQRESLRRIDELAADLDDRLRQRRDAIVGSGDYERWAAHEPTVAPEDVRAWVDRWTWHRVTGLRQPNNTAVAEDRPLGPENGFDIDQSFDARKPDGSTVHWKTHSPGGDGWTRVMSDNAANFYYVAFDTPGDLGFDGGFDLPLTIASRETLWKPVRFRVWLDDAVVFDRRFRQDEIPMERTLTIPVEPGRHSLKIQVAAFGGPLRGQFRVDADELAKQLTASVDDEATRERYTRFVDPAGLELRRQREHLRRHRIAIRNRIPVTMISRERDEVRPTHLLVRGAYDHPGDAVARGVPTFLAEKADVDDRLEFARWLTSGDHPLTARVQVNRIWKSAFGRGLVGTDGDFGLQGSRPTHPRLLDDLAVDYVRGGWSSKRVLRDIVLSGTFGQSSIPRGLDVDPTGESLAFYPRRRMPAEVIRDTRLQAGGLIAHRIGGRGVKPPQPAGLWEPVSQPNSTTARFVADDVPRHYRRSMYLFWKRTAPPPSMQTFDAPMRDACVVDRGRTNTPLQALALLNEYQNLQAAAGMARRFGRAGRFDVASAFRAATGREPTPAETDTVRRTHRELIDAYRDATDDVAALSDSVGWNDVGASARFDAATAAATLTASMLLNLSESVTIP